MSWLDPKADAEASAAQADPVAAAAVGGDLVICPQPHPNVRPLKRTLIFPAVLLCLALAASRLFPVLDPDLLWLLKFYALYALAEVLLNRRLKQCSKPVRVVFAHRQVIVSEHAFWQRRLRQRHEDLADYAAVASFVIPASAAADGIHELRTVLLPRKGYLKPLLMDWHTGGGSADKAAAAELRARIAAATGLPDAGYLGQCRADEVWLRYRQLSKC